VEWDAVLAGDPKEGWSEDSAIGPEDIVVSWISQGAVGLTTGSWEVMGYPRDGTGAMEVGAAGCLGMSRDSRVGSGRLAGGARYRGDCGTSRYVT